MTVATRPRRLSRQEREVTERRMRGDTVNAIALDLGVSRGSVAEYQARAFDKLGVGSLKEAVELVGNLAVLFRHAPDGSPLTLTLMRDDLRELRDAYAAIARGLGKAIAVLDRVEGTQE